MCLLFSDVQLPYQIPVMDGLYKGLGIFNLEFLPNTPSLIEEWASAKSTNNGTRLLTSDTDNNFLFLTNIGCIITFILAFAIVYSIVILLSWKMKFIEKIRGYFEWNGCFMLLLFIFYVITRAAFIQLREVSNVLNILVFLH